MPRSREGWVLTALQNSFFHLLHAETWRRGSCRRPPVAVIPIKTAASPEPLGACHGLGAVPARWREKVLACRPEAGFGGR